MLACIFLNGSGNPQDAFLGFAGVAKVQVDRVCVVSTFRGTCVAAMHTAGAGLHGRRGVVLTPFSMLSRLSADIDEVQDFDFAIG